MFFIYKCLIFIIALDVVMMIFFWGGGGISYSGLC